MSRGGRQGNLARQPPPRGWRGGEVQDVVLLREWRLPRLAAEALPAGAALSGPPGTGGGGQPTPAVLNRKKTPTSHPNIINKKSAGKMVQKMAIFW